MTNEEMDGKILEAIRGGCLRAMALQEILKLGPGMAQMRAVNYSLQRLKNRGSIYYDRSYPDPGWRIVRVEGRTA